MDKHIITPITEEISKDLHVGDYVYISGTIYVARDAANSFIHLYLGKPQRDYPYFIPKSNCKYIAADVEFEKFNLEIDDFEDLKWEDGPVEVFVKMED